MNHLQAQEANSPAVMMSYVNTACIISNAVLNPAKFSLSFCGGIAVGLAEIYFAKPETKAAVKFFTQLAAKDSVGNSNHLSVSNVGIESIIKGITLTLSTEPSPPVFVASSLFPLIANLSNNPDSWFLTWAYLSGAPLGRSIGNLFAVRSS
jgi:hypothetical protein